MSDDQEAQATDHPVAAVDPRVQRSRAAIVQAATQQFLTYGYVDTNLDDVAALANISRRTIFNVFTDKQAVFRAVLDQAIETAERYSLEVVDRLGEGDVASELRDAATQLAQAVLGGRIVALRRLLVAEVRRFPELAASYYDRAPGRVMVGLATAFERYHKRGLLSVDHPLRAAEHFAFLVLGASLDHAMFTPDTTVVDQDLVLARAHTGVDTFLRAYGRQTAR